MNIIPFKQWIKTEKRLSSLHCDFVLNMIIMVKMNPCDSLKRSVFLFLFFTGKNYCSLRGRNVGSETGNPLLDETKCSQTFFFLLRGDFESLKSVSSYRNHSSEDVFPEQSAWFENPFIKSFYRAAALTWPAHLHWETSKNLPETHPAPTRLSSSRRGPLTQPDADPSYSRFDHFNAYSADGSDSALLNPKT